MVVLGKGKVKTGAKVSAPQPINLKPAARTELAPKRSVLVDFATEYWRGGHEKVKEEGGREGGGGGPMCCAKIMIFSVVKEVK